MNAVLRVWWTFFTAVPLQRWLGGIGAALGVALAVAGLAIDRAFWIVGVLWFFILAAFPALFVSGAVFRALSAPRGNQLLAHFRTRMLGAVALFVATLLALVVVFFVGAPPPPGRGVLLDVLVYAFTFVTGMFVVTFLQFGDWRWLWLWIGASVGLGALGLSESSARVLSAVPPPAWLAATLAAWAAFAVWYLRARRIRPLALVPQPLTSTWSRADLVEPVTRETALRVILRAQLPQDQPRLFLGIVGTVVAVAVIVMVFLSPAARLFHFTSFVWPFGMMLITWGKATAVVHRSRLLWLRTPGSRDAVRRHIERAVLRSGGGTLLVLLVAAALYVSPLVATAPLQVLAGFALAASAVLFGAYVAFAAVPGGAVHLASFGVMMALQLALLARFSPSLTAVGIVTAVELAGAIAFRMLALKRWRHVDWLRLRPLPQSNMLRGA